MTRTTFIVSLPIRSIRPCDIYRLHTSAQTIDTPKTDTLPAADLDQEREMLDIPGIGIVKVKWLKMTSEHNL